MTTNYYIEKRETCLQCNGDGWIANPMFMIIFRDKPQKEAQAICEEEGIQEEIMCPTCEGSGVEHTHVSLRHALTDILKGDES